MIDMTKTYEDAVSDDLTDTSVDTENWAIYFQPPQILPYAVHRKNVAKFGRGEGAGSQNEILGFQSRSSRGWPLTLIHRITLQYI
jgi:hypothetical protein